MKTTTLILTLALCLPGIAVAFDCPNLVHEIDEILAARPDLDEETIVDEDTNRNVRQLRDEGKALHDEGRHAESVKVLQKALALLKSEG